jgi:hypothetical protein
LPSCGHCARPDGRAPGYRDARKVEDEAGEKAAHAAVDVAKRGLGERGPAWWSNDAPDYTRHMTRNTPYADWFAHLRSPRRYGFVRELDPHGGMVAGFLLVTDVTVDLRLYKAIGECRAQQVAL